METKCFLGCSMCLEGFWAVLSALLFSIKLQLKGELKHEHFVSFLMAENSIPVAHGKAGVRTKLSISSLVGWKQCLYTARPCHSPGTTLSAAGKQKKKCFEGPFPHFQNHPLLSLCPFFFQDRRHQTLCCTSGPSAQSHSQEKFKFCSILTTLKVCEWHQQGEDMESKEKRIKGRILHPLRQRNGNGKAVKSLQNKERDEIWTFQLNPGIKHPKNDMGYNRGFILDCSE